MPRFNTGRWLLCGLALVATAGSACADDPDRLANDKRALAAVQTYVGTWRGVGQPKRGSSQGAWTEESQWSWRFEHGRAALVGELKGNKYFSRVELQAGDEPRQFIAWVQPVPGAGAAEPKPRRFSGALADGALTLTADEPVGNEPARVTVRMVAGGDRMLLLAERRIGEGAYSRLAEVGSTRKGSSFAKMAASGPECVVTGGLGTIAVEYQGKKYFVCCTGCRDLFNDDPAGVLAEYRQRKAAEQEKKSEP